MTDTEINTDKFVWDVEQIEILPPTKEIEKTIPQDKDVRT